jgi:light-regulated signal transduction histidine kinase (bacteriophytochrome)
VSYLADNLARRWEQKNDPTSGDISAIQSAAQRMSRLLDDAAAYAAAAGPLALGPVDMEEVRRAARSNLGAMIQAERAVIEQEPLPVVHGDFEHLVRLFQHLLANAVKSRGDDEPRVHVGCSTSEAGWFSFVRDNGIGGPAQISRTDFRRVQAIALAQRVPRHRAWAGDLPANRRSPWRPPVARVAVGEGSTFFFTIARPSEPT